MPKPTASPARSNKTSYLPLIIIGAIILLLCAGLVAWKVYHNQLVAADKARFAQAERDIDDLSREVIATIGQPAKAETQKYCSRPNMKFEEGPLSCHITARFYYAINTVADASTNFVNIVSIVESKWKHLQNAYSSNSGKNDSFLEADLSNYDNNNDYQQKNKKYKTSSDMECMVVSLLYPTANPPYKENMHGTSPFTLKIDLICGDYAKIEHFPMKS